MNRKILIILRNRFDPNAKIRHVEMECENDGTIVDEKPLKKAPAKPVYDEVWENDEGKDVVKYCNRIKRLYRHPLQKKKA